MILVKHNESSTVYQVYAETPDAYIGYSMSPSGSTPIVALPKTKYSQVDAFSGSITVHK